MGGSSLLMSVAMMLACLATRHTPTSSSLVLHPPASLSHLCPANVTAQAGMTARLFCCLAVTDRGEEVSAAAVPA